MTSLAVGAGQRVLQPPRKRGDNLSGCRVRPQPPVPGGPLNIPRQRARDGAGQGVEAGTELAERAAARGAEEATRVGVMSPLAEPAGLINMIRLAALKDINGGERVQEWLDSHYPDPAVIALLADYVAGKWGTLDQAWWTERFGLGDPSAEELAAELESATDKSVSPKDIGEIADEIASRIVAAYGIRGLE